MNCLDEIMHNIYFVGCHPVHVLIKRILFVYSCVRLVCVCVCIPKELLVANDFCISYNVNKICVRVRFAFAILHLQICCRALHLLVKLYAVK